jgi:solute carrier family 25 protein 38
MRQSLATAAANASGTSVASSSSALPKLGNLANLSTGALARVAAGFVLNPITVLKVRYESTQYSYTSLMGAARDVFAKEGARGFFAGFGATAVRDAPYAGLYVLIYEQSKTYLGTASSAAAAAAAAAAASSGSESLAEKIPPTMTSSATINFVSGLVAAMSATTLTNPFDAIKTRLQLAPGKYRNMFQAAQMMLKHEGIQSMFYGLSLRIGRKAISSALTWTVYEEFIRRAERAINV